MRSVRVVLVDGGSACDLVLTVHRESARVADLVGALVPGVDAAGVLIDRGFVPASRPLAEAGLHDGAEIEVVTRPPDGDRERPGSAGMWLSVVGGLDGGRRLPLPVGSNVVGRRAPVPLRSATVSDRHALVTIGDDSTVSISDLGSRNGTWLGDVAIGARPRRVAHGDVVRVGALEFAVAPTKVDDRPVGLGHRASTTASFNRPPRAAPRVAPRTIELPDRPPADAPRTSFSLVAFAVPVVIAALLVKVAGSPTFALFALLGPLMMVGSALEQRRNGTRSRRRAKAAYARALHAFAREVDAAAAVELATRCEQLPDLAEVTRRAALPSVRLWERRRGDGAEMRLRAGRGEVAWVPELEGPAAARTVDVDAVLARHGHLPRCPVAVDARAGRIVGVTGERPAALAVARSLVVQAAVHHGPADLAIAVLCGRGALAEWDWVKWLPHTRAGGGSPWLAATGADGDAIAAAVLAREGDGPTVLVVVDDEEQLAAHRSAVRSLLQSRAAHVACLVVADAVDSLPATCGDVVELRGRDGLAELRRADAHEPVANVLATGCALDVARECALALARFDDPDVDGAVAALPERVSLFDLLPVDRGAVDDCVARVWAAAADDAPPSVPIGVGMDGVVELDLARDGPHALVAGTTGAGKSELLRTLVAGLAARLPPSALSFLLIDFKGGSAFDACARLPHVVGVVTDLDERLAARALRCLDAEVRARERVLREHGAPDLAAYRRGRGEPLPRLVVVVDEFATLKAEVPGFVDALVGVAQRGRSLGVHLVLATQRPAGAVSDNIRANTGLRIALRVQDAADAVDVVGDASAAAIPRACPGRAIVRLGPGELVAMQTALATGASKATPERPIAVTPFAFGPLPVALDAHGGGPTDLDVLVDACTSAFGASGASPPRPVWTEPLPDDIDLASLGRDGDDAVVFGVADDPDHQQRRLLAWRPNDGNLLVWGIRGSGTTTALASIAVAAASARSPDDLHVYVIGRGPAELAPLGDLPHCGALIDGADRERTARLLRDLRAEVARRRARTAGGTTPPATIVLLDGYAGFAAERADLDGMAVLDDLVSVFTDGPAVGIHMVLAADRVGAVPPALTALTRQRLLLRLADPHDGVLAGVAARPPSPAVPGRGIDAESGLEVQVARPRRGLAAAVAAIIASTPRPSRPPAPVGVLPVRVTVGHIAGASRLDARPWRLAIGIGERKLRPVGLALHEGEHALVAGPPRSGRSTALVAIASAFRAGAPTGRVVAIAGARSPLAAVGLDVQSGDVAAAVDALARGSLPALIVVDDAEHVDDPSGALASVVERAPAHLALVAAGNADALRTAYGHWTRGLRRSKTGVLLQPNVDLDGELVGTVLPRRAPVALTVGRGWLVSAGALEVVQIAS